MLGKGGVKKGHSGGWILHRGPLNFSSNAYAQSQEQNMGCAVKTGISS